VKLKHFAVMTGMALSGIGVSGIVTPANALTFNFTPAAGTSQLAIDGFNTAGALWSSLFTDNVSININIDFKALTPGVLGETSSVSRSFTYGQVYNALGQDRSSNDDNTAVNSLSKGSTFNMLLNRTANSPNGSGSATPYLDSNGSANNSTIDMTSANAKALGLQGNGGNDASIFFSNLFAWDFDRSNGISTGAFDFVSIAAHEIGHALGFLSGVDSLDVNSSNPKLYNDDAFAANPLDLFRYSTLSRSVNAIDWTADKRAKYFSIDGGVTNIAAVSTGEKFGDGNQTSHWKDDLGIGLMDPTIKAGELGKISENDRRAFDVIGWDLVGNRAVNAQQKSFGVADRNSIVANAVAANTAAVPEPANFIGTFIFAAFGVKMVLNRRQQLNKLEVKG
jgi:hypothetical protein